MYRHEAPRAEELLDSTAGPNASPNASPSSAHVLSQPLVGSTEPRAHGEVFHHIAQGQQTLATADMLEPELGRPAKRFKLNQPNQPNQWQSFQGIAVPAQGFPAPSMTNNAHQSVPPWPQGQSIICKSLLSYVLQRPGMLHGYPLHDQIDLLMHAIASHHDLVPPTYALSTGFRDLSLDRFDWSGIEGTRRRGNVESNLLSPHL